MRDDFKLGRFKKAPFGLDIVWLILPAAIVAMGMAFMPLRSWDYWWHLSFGRMINQTHEMPRFAYFLYTMPADSPSYVQAWMSQWALFSLHESLSLYGMIILRNGLAAGAFLILSLWAAKRSRSAIRGSILALTVLPFGFFIIALRSHLMAWPLIFIVLPIAFRVRTKGGSPWTLVAFPLVTMLWVNLHGTFLVPFLISLSFWADSFLHLFIRKKEFRKNIFIAFSFSTVSSLLAVLVNPRGVDAFLYLVNLRKKVVRLEMVSEWFPTTPFFPEFYGTLFWILFVLSLFLFWRKRKEILFADLILFVGFSFLAMLHCRALMWFFLIFPVVISPYFSLPLIKADEEEPSPFMSKVNVGIFLLLIISAIAVQPFFSFQREMISKAQVMPVKTTGDMAGVIPMDFPDRWVEEIKKINPHARIFHDHRYAGYLIYALQSATPQQTVFVDNRIELSSPQTWALLDEISAGRRVEELRRYDVTIVLVKKSSQAPLLAYLEKRSDWKKQGEDAFNALFVYNGKKE